MRVDEILIWFSINGCHSTDVEDIEVSLSPLNGLDNQEVFSVFREFCGRFGLAQYATISSSM